MLNLKYVFNHFHVFQGTKQSLTQFIVNKPVTNACLFRTYSRVLKENEGDLSQTKSSKSKNIYITLIGVDGIPKTSTLEAALKLSKRRDLKLIKVSDSDAKKNNPVYKLLTSTQILGEDITHRKASKGRTGFKSEKIVSLSSNISENDLKSKVKQIFKWLEKKCEVRVTISGSSDTSVAESIYQKIEAELKNHGRILQKRSCGTDIKFQIVPPKEEIKKQPSE